MMVREKTEFVLQHLQRQQHIEAVLETAPAPGDEIHEEVDQMAKKEKERIMVRTQKPQKSQVFFMIHFVFVLSTEISRVVSPRGF